MRPALGYGVAIVGLALMAGAVGLVSVRANHALPDRAPAVTPTFVEEAWPFLLDQWGVGKAFACADCGGKVEVFVRPKIGFCNCATGVADDQELERVADTDLIASDTRALGASRAVKIGWMHGLSRRYRGAAGKTADGLVSVAYNDECDVVVAVARVAEGADPAAVEPAVVAFLQSRPMVLWAKKELGLEFVKRVW
jgi:hypothetical protein